MDEAALVQSLKLKKVKAQKYAYKKYAGAVYHYAGRYLSNDWDVEEVCSDVFIRVFDKITGFEYKGEGTLWFWMRKITVNECLMRLRKRQLFYDTDKDISELSAKDTNPAVSNMSIKEIQDMVRSLPEGYRTVFNLSVMEGMSHREIADMLGISEQTSKSQLFKARKALQHIILQNNAYERF